MEYLTNLFNNAKNAVISTANSFINKAKASLAQTVVDQFGDEIIDAGKVFVTNKLNDAFDDTVKELNFSTISQRLAEESVKGMKVLEEQFHGLLDTAETGLNDVERDDNNPLMNGAVRLASSLLSKGKTFSKELSKLTEDHILEFRRDIQRAIPDLERNLSDSFVNLFIRPILNFLGDLLRSLFKPQQQQMINTSVPNTNATGIASQGLAPALDANNDDFEEEDDEDYQSAFRIS